MKRESKKVWGLCGCESLSEQVSGQLSCDTCCYLVSISCKVQQRVLCFERLSHTLRHIYLYNRERLFLNLWSSRALAAKFTAKAWVGKKFKNHLLLTLTRVVGTTFDQNSNLQTNMNIFHKLVDLCTLEDSTRVKGCYRGYHYLTISTVPVS